MYQISKYWDGTASEYFNLLKESIKKEKLIYNEKILFESKNSLAINTALKHYVKSGIIDSPKENGVGGKNIRRCISQGSKLNLPEDKSSPSRRSAKGIPQSTEQVYQFLQINNNLFNI